jgi:hypothetical protein
MPRAVVENEPTNQLGLGGGTMLHFHNFNHVKIDWLPPLVLGVCGSPCEAVPGMLSDTSLTFRRGRRPDGYYGINHRLGKLLRHGGIEFCGEGRFCEGDEGGTV